ncbi:MAG: GSCFA domain-containing protein [Paludibacter sp.]|jgi:hypothetical protein|nr:GSCFA domain-containing protein [Paludibacter sp.]
MDKNFRTKVNISPCEWKIDYQSRLISFGSCFSTNIGSKLENAYFQIDVNPFGVLFNPVSIVESIKLLLSKTTFTENDIFEANSLWNSFCFSTLFSDTTLENTLNKINSRFVAAQNNFQLSDIVLITFGTAWVYEDIESAAVVANCHKLPSNRFRRRRLSTDEIVATYKDILQLFPQKKFIFTVSPIRHFKDGATENNRSKAVLLLAIEQITEQFANSFYFPAYEIVNDELRDYRFYSPDMLHPSTVAIDYIWERFGETFFDSTTEQTKQELENFYAQVSHRPIHPNSEQSNLFRQDLDNKKKLLLAKYPFLRRMED